MLPPQLSHRIVLALVTQTTIPDREGDALP